MARLFIAMQLQAGKDRGAERGQDSKEEVTETEAGKEPGYFSSMLPQKISKPSPFKCFKGTILLFSVRQVAKRDAFILDFLQIHLFLPALE